VGEEVVIDRRFRGPPASANGGYTCGLVAAALGTRAAEVSLRVPPPLDRPLQITREDDKAVLRDGDTVVADGIPLGAVELELPQPPPLHEAEDADARYPFYDNHAFPACFVCGPDRAPGDGLRIFPGPLEGSPALACVWTPDPAVAGAYGQVCDEIVWAALDCPSGNAAHHYSRDERTMVLARLRGEVTAPVAVGEPHIVVGWPRERDGRKHRSGTAIFDANGTPVAHADALWIELRV
jgi:hypothetical protein